MAVAAIRGKQPNASMEERERKRERRRRKKACLTGRCGATCPTE